MWHRGNPKLITLPATTVEEENELIEDRRAAHRNAQRDYAEHRIDELIAREARHMPKRVAFRDPNGHVIEMSARDAINFAKPGWVRVDGRRTPTIDLGASEPVETTVGEIIDRAIDEQADEERRVLARRRRLARLFEK